MSRGWWVVVLLVVALVTVAAWLVPRVRGGQNGEIPTVGVERTDFERRVRAEGVLSAVRATPLGPDPAIRRSLRIAWMAPDGSRVKAGDPVVRLDPTELEEQLESAQGELERARLKIDKEGTESGAELENLDRDAALAALELEAAQEFQKVDADLFSRQEIIESQIDETLARHKKSHAEATRKSRQDLSRADLSLLHIDRRRAREKIEEAERQLAALEITAPHDGLVVFQRDWRGNLPRVGDQVFRGNVLAEIPDLSKMQVELYVLEADAGGLEAGKPARVYLDSHPETVYEATVERVDALAKPRLRNSPVQYFSAVLALAESDPDRMKPGQRVRAVLTLEQVPNALVIPRQAVFEKDGERIVYRRNGAGFEAVPVTLGVLGLGRVQVVEGLAEGDEVALTEPGGAPADGGDSEEPRVAPGFGGLGAP